MKFGLGVPTSGPMTRPETLRTRVRCGEEPGCGIVDVPDHIVIPNEIRARCPYSESGQCAKGGGAYLEPLMLRAYRSAQRL